MSMPNIPDINPVVNLDIEGSVNMLLSSIALEEISLSHIINAEAEKIQYVLGTLDTKHSLKCKEYSLDDLLKVNRSIDRTLTGVLKNQIMLHTKLEDTIDLYERFSGKEIYNINKSKEDDIFEEVHCSPEYF